MLKNKYKKKLILTQNRLVSLYLVNRLDQISTKYMHVQEETIPCIDKKTFKQKSDQMRKYRPSIIMTWNPAVYITNARICLSIILPVTTRSSFFYLSGPFLGPANHSKRIRMLLWLSIQICVCQFLAFWGFKYQMNKHANYANTFENDFFFFIQLTLPWAWLFKTWQCMVGFGGYSTSYHWLNPK